MTTLTLSAPSTHNYAYYTSDSTLSLEDLQALHDIYDMQCVQMDYHEPLSEQGAIFYRTSEDAWCQVRQEWLNTITI